MSKDSNIFHTIHVWNSYIHLHHENDPIGNYSSPMDGLGLVVQVHWYNTWGVNEKAAKVPGPKVDQGAFGRCLAYFELQTAKHWSEFRGGQTRPDSYIPILAMELDMAPRVALMSYRVGHRKKRGSTSLLIGMIEKNT